MCSVSIFKHFIHSFLYTCPRYCMLSKNKSQNFKLHNENQGEKILSVDDFSRVFQYKYLQIRGAKFIFAEVLQGGLDRPFCNFTDFISPRKCYRKKSEGKFGVRYIFKIFQGFDTRISYKKLTVVQEKLHQREKFRNKLASR